MPSQEPMFRSTLEQLLRELIRASSFKIITLARIEGKLDDYFVQLKQEIHNVGTSLSAQLDAVEASLAADVTALSTDVTNLLNEILAAQPGSAITQTQINALTAIDAKLKALDAAANAPPSSATVSGAASTVSGATA